MRLLANRKTIAPDVLPAQAGHPSVMRFFVSSWEIYLLLALALFLRLYHINLTEFDGDQATIFRMAREAISQGRLVATSNGASIGITNPPAVIYLLMITAVFSANPIWAAVLTAMMAVAAVLLTYLFTRRYFGRLPAFIAALAYAVTYKAIFYSRFIWNQNFLHLFVILFFFALFWGAVERRKGWFFPALFLVGLLAQLHATGLLLAAPLLVAVVLASGTIRIRDVLLGLLSLALLYLPYLLWELSVNFFDIQLLLNPTKQPAIWDNEALLFYQSFLSPFQEPFTERRSILFPYAAWFGWLTLTLTILLLIAAILALILVFAPKRKAMRGQTESEQPVKKERSLLSWWHALSTTPERSALLLLLVWQIAPLVYLSRHSLPIYAHYFIIFLPGQFILIGFLLARLMSWAQHWGYFGTAVRSALSILTTLILVAQFIASLGQLHDFAVGRYTDTKLSRPYYNDLHSLQQALQTAADLAQQRHLHHLYIATDDFTLRNYQPIIDPGTLDDTRTVREYLAEQLHTPTTLFDRQNCLVLPGPDTGPAVLLVGPYNTVTQGLLRQFARATLVSRPARLGGEPYSLYIVEALAAPPAVASPAQTFTSDLRLLDPQLRSIRLGNTQRLVTRWQLLRTRPPASRVSYNYHFNATTLDRNSLAEGTCFFSALQVGDQVVTALPQSASLPTTLALQADYQEVHPYTLSYGPLMFETFKAVRTPRRILMSEQGKDSLLLVRP